MPKRSVHPHGVASMRLALSLLPCVFLAACLTEPKRCDGNPSDPATEQFAPALGIDLSKMEKTTLGDYRTDVVTGTGAQLNSLSVVEIHYSAYLSNGTLIDQVIDQPYQLDLNTRATVGLADGMLGMKEGGQRVIVAPSDLALGPCDNGPVPGNSTIVYKVELLTID
jgi:hypothetical protein